MNNNKENTEYRTFTYDVCCWWCDTCGNEVKRDVFDNYEAGPCKCTSQHKSQHQPKPKSNFVPN
jgi:hypothetical protein